MILEFLEELRITHHDRQIVKCFGYPFVHRIGLVNQVLPDVDGCHKAAQEMANEIAANSPLAVQGTKAVLKASDGRSVEEGLDYVGVWNAAFLASNDLTEAFTAFLEKRPPKFTGE